MKRIVSLLLVLVLVLCCFVGCENNVESNEVSSEIILDENRPNDRQIFMNIVRYAANRGYGVTNNIQLTRADYDSSTKLCVVEFDAELFEKRNGSNKHYASYQFTYKLVGDDEWELTDEYPKVLGSDYMPDIS